MAVKTYRKTALVSAEQFLPAIGQIPAGVYSSALGHPSKRPDAEWVLDTKEARHTLRVGDYICTGPAGEQWNVASEIFEATHKEAKDSPTSHVGRWIGDGERQTEAALSIDREALTNALIAELGDTYSCTRVWSAWCYGTMTQDDFEPAEDRAGEIADSIIRALEG